MLQAVTLDQLRTFAAVAEAGSFRAAARRLFRSQSAVSQSVANLERELGVVLFDRSGHRAVVTAEGRALLEDVRTIVSRVDGLRSRASAFSDGVELTLSIVADPIFPAATLADALKGVREHYPGVQLRVASDGLGAPLSALANHGADLSIVVGDEFRHPEMAFEALSVVEMQAVAAPHHPLARWPGAITSAELGNHLQIVLEDASAWTDGQDFGVVSPRTWRVRGQELKRTLIAQGIGWGRLPSWLVDSDVSRGQLKRLDVPTLGIGGASELQAFLVRRNDTAPGPAARRFASLLGDRAATRRHAD